MAQPIVTHCLAPIRATFRCPIWNEDPNRRPDVEGEYRLKCQVCGVSPYRLIDLDTRTGYLLVDVQFGPNLLDGEVDEGGIINYAVFMTDTMGTRLSSQPVAMVEKGPEMATETAFCCKDDAYTARIATQFPTTTDKVLFEIVPVTSAGPLPAGRLTGMVMDTVFRTSIAQARRRAAPGSTSATFALALLLAASVAALATARDP